VTQKTTQINGRLLRVFLCHASADKQTVRGLYKTLREDGFDPWLDEEDLVPGQDWRVEIPQAVHNADVVLVCLSTHSIGKEGYVQKEIKFALDTADEKPEGTIFIIPVRLEDCPVPQRLSRWQWVDLATASGYERLQGALRRRATALGLSASTPTKEGVSLESLRKLNSAVKAGSPEALAALIQDLGLDRSAVAKRASRRFFDWLTTYYHFGYDSIGDALHEWLTADSGVDQLGEDWRRYLRLAGCVLISTELREGVPVKGSDGNIMTTLSVPTSDDWLEFLDEGMFRHAVAENRDNKQRFTSGLIPPSSTR
jgi:hypothetical protein